MPKCEQLELLELPDGAVPARGRIAIDESRSNRCDQARPEDPAPVHPLAGVLERVHRRIEKALEYALCGEG